MLIDPDNLNMRYNFACVLATRLGDPKGALSFIDRILAVGSPAHIRVVQTDPDLDSLRGHPRFQEMLARAEARLGMAAAPADAAGAAPATPAASSAPLRS